MPQIFDQWNREWAGAREELKSLLTEDEYKAAAASTKNAHYTSPTVVKGMWAALEHLGVSAGATILEPSLGIGNFFGLQPESLLPARRTGVELDQITGQLAKALYPDSNIQITGFERLPLPNDFFDVAISNVPFGNYGVHDPKYSRTPLATSAIHNYFFVRTVDTLRPGGVLAFVTSSYTMDGGKWAPVREMLSAKADLLGAIRLPNTAFKSNAGTEVTTDIIFLQKRAPGAERAGETWAHLSSVKTSDGRDLPVNEYFAKHPDMMLGRMEYEGKMYAAATPTLVGTVTAENLRAAIEKLPAKVYRPWTVGEEAREGVSVYDLGDEVKDGGFALKDGVLARREGGIYRPVEVNKAAAERIKGLLPVRQALREVFRTQVEDKPEKEIKAARTALNKAYDKFVKQHGPINARANINAFQPDPDFANLQALEEYDKEANTAEKTQVFTERTIQRAKTPEKVERADEALAVVLNEKGRIDWDRMQQLTGKTPEELREDMRGLVYQNPAGAKWETADSYLSGNVREKLEQAEAAAEADPRFQANAEALRKVIPPDLPQEQIRVGLGAAWIPPEIVQNFVAQVLNLQNAKVNYTPQLALWSLEVPKWERERAANAEAWNADFYGHDLLDMALNNKSPKVYTGPSDKRVLDPTRTAAAQAAQDNLRRRFEEWAWEDEARAKYLTHKYNRQFNALKAREFDGSHLDLPGKNPAITLRPHQLNAVWRALQTGNTLLAHEVGAGKTYEMVAIAMESRRLGLAKKPMIVIPNHMIEQFGREFKQLYPNARIYAVDRAELKAGKRQLAMARIAQNNWDAVIVAQSSFGKIGVSDQTFAHYMGQQIDELIAAKEAASEAARANGEKADKSRTVKEIQKAISRLQTKIENRAKRHAKDKSLHFEELGVDLLLVDEAHAYKKLPIITSRTRVAGLPTGESQRAMDLHMKVGHVTAPSGGKRGLVFATGTPITNTLAEMYNMQRFLQPATLRDLNIQHFDAWANTFAKAERGVELDVSGKSFRENTRFSKFINMPELATIFRQMADVKQAKDLNLPRPKVEGGGTQAISVPATEAVRQYVDALQKRAEAIRNGKVDPREDNMLKITSEGKKAALDLRLLDPEAEDHPESKVNRAVRNIVDIWKETKAERSTQIVFCDLSTPKSEKAKKAKAKVNPEEPEDDSEEGESTEPETENTNIQGAGEAAGFSVYDDMRQKLINAGIPSEEIAFIHDYNKDADKALLFKAVNEGKVRVLFGSTEKMGVGTNVQRKLLAMHHMDTPWRPADVTQREGRILRQGNQNDTVRIYQYLTEGSMDAFSWQTIATKAGMVGQALNGDLSLREVEDVGLVIPTASEFMAQASGDPIIRENIGVTAELARLGAQRAGHQRQIANIRDQLATLPGRIGNYQKEIADLNVDLQTVEKHKEDGFTIGKRAFSGDKARQEAAEALDAALQSHKGPGNPVKVGRYQGLDLWTRPALTSDGYPGLNIRGKSTLYANTNAEDPLSAIASVESVVRNAPKRLVPWQKEWEEATKKLADLQRQDKKPFAFENRFQELVKRKAEIDGQLAKSKEEAAAAASEEKSPEQSALDRRRQDGEAGSIDADLLTLGLGSYLKNDVLPGVKKAAAAFKIAKDDVAKWTAPASRSEEAKTTAQIVRANAAKYQRSMDRADAALRLARKFLGDMPEQERWDFVDAIETGQQQPDASLEGIAKSFRQMLDSRRDAIQNLGTGKLENFIEDYFPHIWKDTATSRDLFQPKRPLEGSKSFLKQRKIPTTKEGLALGLEPVSDNPVDLVLAKVREMDKYLMAHTILAELKERGLLTWKRATGDMPEGYAKIEDRVAQRWGTPSHPGATQFEGEYVAPEPVARILNNYLMPGLRQKSVIFRGLLTASNSINQAQLGWSAFHASFTTMDVMISKLALGFYQAMHGDVLDGAKTAAQTFAAPIANPLRGAKMLKEWYQPGSMNPQIRQLVDAVVEAGGRAHMDDFYETSITKNCLEAFRSLNPWKMVVGGVTRVPFALTEQAARPIMEWLVPRQKLGVFADIASYELKRLGPNATADEQQEALTRAWDSTDNRLGQLVYDNKFWNKVTKDLAMLSVRSVGWNVGTIAEVGGAIPDTVKFLGRKGDFTHKMAYVVALHVLGALAGAVAYYLWHGHAPKHLMDYYFPVDARGHRWALPTYEKDIYHWAHDPASTAKGKVNPLLSLTWEMLSNRDYFSHPIANPHHSLVKRMEERALHVAKVFIPMSVRPKQTKESQSTEDKVLPYFGITRAPKSLGDLAQ